MIQSVEPESDGVRWASRQRMGRVTEKHLREAEASDKLFEAATSKYAGKLRRARLARQVRINGWGATDGIITRVALMCRVPDVDQAAVIALFDGIEVEWFAVLPDGRIRQVSGWNSATNSWLTVADT